MRRGLAALTATAVLIPLVVTAAPGTASAATNTLTITVIDRDGTKVSTGVSVVNIGSNEKYRLTSGKARKLPKGTYAAMAHVYTRADQSSTLGGRTVKVSGASKTTIDARNGRRLGITLSPGLADGYQSVQARVCASNGSLSSSVEAYTDPNRLYVIPNSSKNFRFAYASHWLNYQGTRESYVVTGGMKGIPKSFSRTVKRSSLARVTMNVRSGPALTRDISLQAETAAKGCSAHLAAGLDRATAPYRYTVHLSPGRWQLNADGDGIYQSRLRTVAGGKSYSQTFLRSAWGPAGTLPVVIRKRLSFWVDDMFRDPGMTGSGSWDFSDGTKGVVTLTKGGKVLKKQTRHTWYDGDNATFHYRLSSAGWYGLTVDAKRYNPNIKNPSGLLSNRATAKFRFHADPSKNRAAPVHLTRIVPNGLDMTNSAKPGSTTTIDLTPLRPDAIEDARLTKVKIKSVTARVSFDNGKTWKTAGLRKSGGTWVASVKNPASGYATVRATVVDTKGNSSEITVYRAYRVG